MQQPDGGGSDVSYESVLSEGGFEAATDRGRDTLPRIISSSNCVQVFRRLRWDSGFNCRATSPDEEEERCAKARGGSLSANYALHDLPRRPMRFDGAIEAWLEEYPPPHHAERPLVMYSVINDAASRPDLSILEAGNRAASIWYFNVEFLQQLWPSFLQYHPDQDCCAGVSIWKKELLSRGCVIQSTHIDVGRVNYPLDKRGKDRGQWLKNLFAAMQTSQWSPNGEARELLHKKRLTHAAMSVGDAVQIGRDLYMVTFAGFERIPEAGQLLPPSAEGEDILPIPPPEEGELDETSPVSLAACLSPTKTPSDPKNTKNKKNKGKGKADKEEIDEAEQANGKAHEHKEDEGRGQDDGQGDKANGKKKRNRAKKNQNGGEASRGWQEASWQDTVWPYRMAEDSSWTWHSEQGWGDGSWQGNWGNDTWQASGAKGYPSKGSKGAKGGKGGANGRSKGEGSKGDSDSTGNGKGNGNGGGGKGQKTRRG